MSNQAKITLQQAARLVGLHVNTIKNWRRAGRLTTAELLTEKGIQVWYVDPNEIIQIATQTKATIDQSYPDNSHVQEPTATPSPGTAQMLDLIRESITRPLTDLIATQSAKIEELSKQVGSLEEQVKQLQRSSETPSRQEATSAPERAESMPDVPRKRRWWQR